MRRRSLAFSLAPPVLLATLWGARAQDAPPAQDPPPAQDAASAGQDAAAAAQTPAAGADADAAHVVAAHLEGSWEPEPALWERVTGRVIPHSLPAVDARLRIVRDDRALDGLAPDARALLGAGEPLLAGWIHDFGPSPAPFALTFERGLARLSWLQSGDGAQAAAETRLVELVLASKPEGDLLFLGPAAPSRAQPFKPYRREQELAYGDRVGRAKVVLVQLENAAIAYAADHEMRYPARLEDLIAKEGEPPYLQYPAVPKDPWGHEYGYAPPAPGDGLPLPTFTCFGADGAAGGEGEARDFDNHMIRAGEI